MSKENCLIIGCGATDSSYGDIPNNIIALDVDWNILEDYHSKNPRVTAVVADAKSLPFKPESIDQIQATHVLEHLNGVTTEASMSEIHRVAKSGANIVLATPHNNYEKVLGYLVERYHSKDMHQQTVSLQALSNLAEKVQLKVIHKKTQRWDHAIKVIATAVAHRIKPKSVGFKPQVGFVLEQKMLGGSFTKRAVNSIVNLLKPLSPILNKIIPYENLVIAQKQ
jgi:predicted SAM-dependent methyltransferase